MKKSEIKKNIFFLLLVAWSSMLLTGFVSVACTPVDVNRWQGLHSYSNSVSRSRKMEANLGNRQDTRRAVKRRTADRRTGNKRRIKKERISRKLENYAEELFYQFKSISLLFN